MQRQISSEQVLSCATPTPAIILAANQALAGGGLQAAPEEIRKAPEHAGSRRPAPRLRAIAHREVSDQRGGKIDGEAGVGPLLEPCRRRCKYQHHPEELGPREFQPEVGGKAEV